MISPFMLCTEAYTELSSKEKLGNRFKSRFKSKRSSYFIQPTLLITCTNQALLIAIGIIFIAQSKTVLQYPVF